MPFAAVAFRLLLVAALVLNGIGSAVAGTRMLAMAGNDALATPTHHAAKPEPGAHASCHEHAAQPDAPAPAPEKHGKGGADCCHSGLCSCHCLQQAQAHFVPPALASPQPLHAASLRAMSSAHASPRLPHLIRPPIVQMS